MIISYNIDIFNNYIRKWWKKPTKINVDFFCDVIYNYIAITIEKNEMWLSLVALSPNAACGGCREGDNGVAVDK